MVLKKSHVSHNFYRQNAKDVMRELDTSRKGLTKDEAEKRLSKFGQNTLKIIKKERIWQKYLRQFNDPMIILLGLSAIISGALLQDFRTAIVLSILVLVNTSIGFFQEFKAEKVMESLEKLVHPVAKVCRDGKVQEIFSADLVEGDIVYIEEGDKVPADLRLIEESELSTNDFALTGESNPTRKFTHSISEDVELADRHNLVFMGTTVATGHAFGIVIATAMTTELGRIASLSQGIRSELSPLQKEMNNITKRITQATLLLGSLLAIIAWKTGLTINESFLFAIGIASSLIPQGLPAEINSSLAQASGKLAKARALIKKLSAVETLGSTKVICTDKTGTLTKNEMTVQHLLIGNKFYSVSGTGYENNGTISKSAKKALSSDELESLKLFFETGIFASNAQVNPPDETHSTWYIVGDPTEGAIITLARKAGLDDLFLQKNRPELKEFAFDSARKLMSSIRKNSDNKSYCVFVKGAPENVLSHSSKIWDGVKTKKITNSDKKFLEKQNANLANKAMRNLAFAYKVLPTGTTLSKLKMEDAEKDLIFLGMVSMIDPLREEVPEAMLAAQSANIKVSIITGDYTLTAKAIATKANLAEKDKLIIITGNELRQLEDSRVLDLVLNGGVIFSRVAPEDKLRIVSLVQNSGTVVAVTGDGINDAPALKRADIGVAMGLTGTDVAKQTADIILLDDSFHTLVGAIKQGRIIFQNIKKGTLSCLTSNSAELFANLISLALSAMFNIPLAITVMQILAIDLIAELFPIAALGWDDAEQELMKEEPRKSKNHILNKKTITDLIICGIIIGGLAISNHLLYYLRNDANPLEITKDSLLYPSATAMTYLTIVLCQFGNIFQRRSPKGLFTKFQFTNRRFWLAMSLSLVCVLNIIYNPWIAPYFGTGPLKLMDWLFAVIAAIIFLLFRELQNNITKRKLNNV